MVARRWYLSPLLVAHAVVVLGLAAVTLAMVLTSDPDDGADIGAGVLSLPLISLGLPWSLLNVYDKFVAPVLPESAYDFPTPWWFDAVQYSFLYGPGLLNIVLRAVVVRRVSRRRAVGVSARTPRTGSAGWAG